MKQLKNFFTVKWYAMLSALLSLLGYAACGDKEEYGAELYGQPYAQFKVDGAVLNEDNEPLEKISVYVKDHYGDTVSTGKDGKFSLEAKRISPEKTLWLMAVDKSGTYQIDSVELTTKFEGANHNWYEGSYETTHDFTLKKKSEEPVDTETDTNTTDETISEE